VCATLTARCGRSYCTLERALCRGDWLSGALVGGQLIDLSLRGHVAIPAHGIEAVVRPAMGGGVILMPSLYISLGIPYKKRRHENDLTARG
jgi:hypothetical protein